MHIFTCSGCSHTSAEWVKNGGQIILYPPTMGQYIIESYLLSAILTVLLNVRPDSMPVIITVAI